MDSVVQDIRHAVRQLLRTPGFTLVAVLTLAIGIGATTAVYSLANWLFTRPVPGTTDAGRLVTVALSNGPRFSMLSYRDYQDFAERVTAFDGLAGEVPARPVAFLAPGAAARRLDGSTVTANYFAVLGVHPLAGRFFEPGDFQRGAPQVAVISHRLWQDLFQGDRAIVGRVVDLEQLPTTIVGVAPPSFTGTRRVTPVDVWRPVTVKAAREVTGADAFAYYFEGRRSSVFTELIGRLAAGSSRAQAQAQLQAVIGGILAEMPGEAYMLRGQVAEVYQGIGLPLDRREPVAKTIRTLAWVAAVLVLLAVANATNLMLMRAVARRGEMSVRRALGATPWRLGRQSVFEGGLISVAAACGAVLVAVWVTTLFRGLDLGGRLTVVEVPVDVRVLAFALLAGVCTGPVVGLVPMLLGARVAGPWLRSGSGAGKRQGRGYRFMAAIQLGACFTLLVVALLLVGSFRNLRGIDVGFEPEGLTSYAMDVDAAAYSPDQAVALRDEGADRIRRLAGVRDVAQSYVVPFSGGMAGAWPIYREGDPTEQVYVIPVYVTPEYFGVVGIPLVRGTSFSHGRRTVTGDGEREAVISESAARWLFGDQDPVGRRFSMPGGPSPAAIMSGAPLAWSDPVFRVVGVARDARWSSVASRELGPVVYRSMWETTVTSGFGVNFLVRSSGTTSAMRAAVTAELRRVAPRVPVVATDMDERIDASLSEQRLFAGLVSWLTVLALALAGVGLFALVSFLVSGQTKEFGVRMALGAQRREILDLVVRQGVMLAAVGLAIGLAGAVVLARFLSSRLFGVTALEPSVYLLAIVGLVVLTLVASLVPAQAATKVDPMVVLRAE